MSSKTVPVVFLAMFVALCASSSRAQSQYQAIILHPAGLGSTFALGAANGVQVGYSGSFGSDGIVWRGSPESAVFIHPAGASTISLHATDGTRHVGQAAFGRTHALLWLSDNSEDYVDLHVSEFVHTTAGGLHGDQQVGVGWRKFETQFDALLWRGTAGSMVNLHPIGEQWSRADAVHSGSQVGAVSASTDEPRAALWRGTAESFVDLSNNIRSHALGVHGNQQVGWIDPPGPTRRRAALWYGTAESFTNLTPAGSAWAELSGTNGTYQVGQFEAPGSGHAGRWSGTADSVLDLNQFLPPEYRDRGAYAYHIDDDGIIVGRVRHPTGLSQHAVMWVPVPEPATISALGFGLLAFVFGRRRRLIRGL